MEWNAVVQNRNTGEPGAHEEKKKKELTSFKIVIFFVCFLPPRFLFYRMVVFFPRKWQSCKGPITTGYAKGLIIIVLNVFLIFEVTYFSIIINAGIVHQVLLVHTLMFIMSVNSFLKMKNCVSTLRLLNYIRNTLLVYRRSKVNLCEMFGEYNEKSLTKIIKNSPVKYLGVTFGPPMLQQARFSRSSSLTVLAYISVGVLARN